MKNSGKINAQSDIFQYEGLIKKIPLCARCPVLTLCLCGFCIREMALIKMGENQR